MTDKKKSNFKPVQISKDDWEMYNQLAISLSATRGERISIAAVIKESVEQYIKTL